MQFDPPLIPATLLRRYKRFLGDVRLADGRELTVHTPNTGAMLGCSTPGRRVWLRDTQNPKRKYRYAWELSESEQGACIGVNTTAVNRLVSEAVEARVITELQGYATVRQEVAYGEEGSRIDLLLEGTGRPSCYVEIKNVTARDDSGTAFFPDAVSARGSKHLRELAAMAQAGARAVLCFCVQRGDVAAVRPADEIDPLYGRTLRQALEVGVEVIAYRAAVSPEAIALNVPLPLELAPL